MYVFRFLFYCIVDEDKYKEPQKENIDMVLVHVPKKNLYMHRT